jgi:hypothetical protein
MVHPGFPRSRPASQSSIGFEELNLPPEITPGIAQVDFAASHFCDALR